ncbi:hypothetical protein Fmac_015929 [Flemingia macrophylla]|uniref:Uncharacterized protein n=1 Tax=Flemingia macrophylla TaxID=520843 RepID=A0ABD1MG06_9FABA
MKGSGRYVVILIHDYDNHPILLTLDPYTDLYPMVDFLLHEVAIPFPNIHLSLSRCPRLLVSGILHQLCPTLHFLRKFIA